MENVVLVIHLILALSLIGVVLLQSSEGGGLGVGGGGGGAASARSAGTALGKVTWILAVAFIATSIGMTIIAAKKAATGSVVDGAVIEQPLEQGAPASPLGDDLLPPSADTETTAPRAD